jgi:outer membrane lipoprotein-sorting protein
VYVSFLRTISTPRLAAVCASACALAAGGTAIALAGGDGSKPPPKPLAAAVHDGLTAPEVQGITARVKFTNHLIDSSGIQGGNPLLSGATGRLWLSPGHGLRLELQSDNGDAQVVANQQGFWVYDGTSNTVYRGDAPKHKGRANERGHKVPSVAKIQRGLNRARKHKLDISGPVPGNIAGQPAYTVRVAPGRPGGLLGAVELAWDAARGLPLRVGVYARGNNDPVLELVATDVQYGPVADSTFSIDPPANATVQDLSMNGGHQGRKSRQAVRRLPFAVSAPQTLAGRQRAGVRKVRIGGQKAALIRYGKDLDAILVVEKAAKPDTQSGARHGHFELPTADINGATAKVIDTPLGSVVTFQRGGVSYTVLGSVPAEVTKAAARGL